MRSGKGNGRVCTVGDLFGVRLSGVMCENGGCGEGLPAEGALVEGGRGRVAADEVDVVSVVYWFKLVVDAGLLWFRPYEWRRLGG